MRTMQEWWIYMWPCERLENQPFFFLPFYPIILQLIDGKRIRKNNSKTKYIHTYIHMWEVINNNSILGKKLVGLWLSRTFILNTQMSFFQPNLSQLNELWNLEKGEKKKKTGTRSRRFCLTTSFLIRNISFLIYIHTLCSWARASY